MVNISMGHVLETNNIKQAIQKVRRNDGCPGIDGVEAKDLNSFWNTHQHRIRKEILEGTYKPNGLLPVDITKPDGGTRRLEIPTVVDRMIQQATLQVISSTHERVFSNYSYGYRPGHSAHQAVIQGRKYYREGYKYVVDIDIKDFFGSIDHQLLMNKLSNTIKDIKVLKLIESFYKYNVDITCGISQGSPLSPLLANIYLDEFDKVLEKQSLKFVRYADDCNVYVKDPETGIQVMNEAKMFLENSLKVKVNMDKSAIDSPSNRVFLGFTYSTGGNPSILISKKAVRAVKSKVRIITDISNPKDLGSKITDLNQLLNGWITYYSLGKNQGVIHNLDNWIVNRLSTTLKDTQSLSDNLHLQGKTDIHKGLISLSSRYSSVHSNITY